MKKVIFTVRTNRSGSTVEETLTLEELAIDEELEGEELTKAIEKAHQEWIWENIDSGYEIEE